MMHDFYVPGVNFIAQGDLWLALLFLILKIVIAVAIVYFAIRFISKYLDIRCESKVKEDSAIVILRERYARGEIDTEEFRQKEEELQQTTGKKT
ncbi:MAG: SHOCT domain-containing protein [Eubacteriales bacterium]|jgi:putative membrane protein